MPFTTPITPLAVALRSASGASSPAVDLDVHATAKLRLDVTTVAGTTPTLVVTVETATTSTALVWRSLGAFTQATGVASEEVRFTGADRYLRVRWTIAGAAAAFTFGVAGVAVLVYANPADVRRYGIRGKALVNENNVPYTDSDLGEYCEASTDEADGLVNAQYLLPLKAWPTDLRKNVAIRASFAALCPRGINPTEPSNAFALMQNDNAWSWLKMLGRGEVSPPGIIDQTPEVEEGGAYVVTDAPRGWGT